MKTARPRLFERLKASLEDGLAFARGELALSVTEVEIPEPADVLAPEQIRELRTRLNLTQAAFARLLMVSVKTIQSWEQGQRLPSGAAIRLLQLLANPDMLTHLVSPRTTRKSRKAVHVSNT